MKETKKIYTLYVYLYEVSDTDKMNPNEILRMTFEDKDEALKEFKYRKENESPMFGETIGIELWEGNAEEGVEDIEDTCDDCRMVDLVEDCEIKYDNYKPLDGCILVEWEWNTFIGYSRNFLGIREPFADEVTEEDLLNGNHECVGRKVVSIISTKEELEDLSNEEKCEHVLNELNGGNWEWSKDFQYIENRVRDYFEVD